MWGDWFLLAYLPFKKKQKHIQNTYFVPVVIKYFSQYGDPSLNKKIEQQKILPAEKQWKNLGAQNQEEYIRWRKDICAVTCLQMVAQNFPALPLPFQPIAFAKNSIQSGVYQISDSHSILGIFWKPFEQFLRGYGIQALFQKYLTLSQIIHKLDSGCIIFASVSSYLHHGKRQNKKSGHVIVIHGYGLENGRVSTFSIKDPAGWQENNTQERPIALTEFLRYYSGRGLILYF